MAQQKGRQDIFLKNTAWGHEPKCNHEKGALLLPLCHVWLTLVDKDQFLKHPKIKYLHLELEEKKTQKHLKQ